MLRALLSVFCMAFILATQAQSQVTVTQTSPVPTQLTPCVSTVFTLLVQKSPGNFLTEDSVMVEVQFPAGINIGSVWGCSQAGVTITIDSTDKNNPRFTLQNLSGSNWNFWYSGKPSCSYFSATTATGLVNIHYPKYNTTTLPTFNSSPYSVSSGWLVYNAPGSVNVNNTMAQYEVSFNRKLIFINTGSVPFTGDILFTDTTENVASETAMRFDNISLDDPAGAVIAWTILTDTSVALKATVTNLPPGDTVEISEMLTQFRCPINSNNTLTHFRLSFGCPADTPLCVNTPFVQTTSAFDPDDRPVMQYTCLTVEKNCPSLVDTMQFRFRNGGSGIADTLFVNVYRRNIDRNLSWFDTNEVRLFRRVGMVETPVNFITLSCSLNTGSLSDDHVVEYRIATTDPVLPGDSIFLEYIERKVCLDTSNWTFNFGYIMNYLHASARFGHPCFPTNWVGSDGNKSVWGFPIQQFNHQQVFMNMTGIMVDEEQKWFEVDAASPLFVNQIHGYFPDELMLDSNVVEFQVELELENGLALLADSVWLVSNQFGVDTFWLPLAVDYTLGNGVDSASGDRALVHFRFPAYFWERNLSGTYRTYGSHFIRSDAWNRFLNNFSVAFKLKAFCDQSPPDANVTITERTYFVYDVNCSPDCKIPLTEVSDNTNINCPGCRLPGWNLSQFEIQRENVHFADNDNNHYPDIYPLQPANPALAHLERVMIGDTLLWDIVAHTSDGDSTPILFDNIGFRYTFAELRTLSPFLDHLEFLGATGVYSIGANNYPITVPVAAGVFAPGKFTINLDTTSLQNYGVPAGPALAANNGHSIHIFPRFRVKDNLTSGTGANPMFAVEEINAWIYMSGVPIHPAMVDANLLVDSIRDSMTGPERAEYLYWCTGWQGRVAGVGMDFTYYNNVHDYGGVWGVTWRDFCRKKLRIQLFTDLAVEHTTFGLNNHNITNQTALHAFEFEFRELAKIDSAQFTVPWPYEIESLQMLFANLQLDTITNQSRYNCWLDWFTPYTYNLADTTMPNDSTVRFYPVDVYEDLTSPPDSCGQWHPFVGDETKRVYIQAILRMKDYDLTPHSMSLAGDYPVTTWVSEFPLTPSNDTVITDTMPAGAVLSRPEPGLITQVLPATQSITSNTLSWTLNLSVPTPVGNPWIRGFMDAEAPFTYIVPVSPSGNITVNSIIRNWNGVACDTSLVNPGAETLFEVGLLGAPTLRSFTVNATYTCIDTVDDDSLIFYTGWNCYGFPTSLDSACFVDTTVVYISPAVSGLQAFLTAPDTVNPCDTIYYQVEIKATGAGDVSNIQVAVNIPPGTGLTYLPGSGIVTHNASNFSFDPTGTGTPFVWDMDTVPFLNGFDGTDSSAYLSFALVGGCGYSGDPVQISITAENYCGGLLGPVNFIHEPFVNLPTAGADTFTLVSNNPVYNACMPSALGSFTVYNAGPNATTSGNSVTLNLPAGLVLLLSTPPVSYSSGSSYTWNIPPGIAPGGSFPVTYQFNHPSPGSLPCASYGTNIEVIGGIEFSCADTICTGDETLLDIPITIHVRKPVLNLSNANLNPLCNTPPGMISVMVNNSGLVPANGIVVNWYCNTPGPNFGCLVATGTVPFVGVGGTVTAYQSVVNSCGGCTNLIAVTTGCQCAPDTLAASVSCEPCEDISIKCPDDVVYTECERCELEIRDIGWPIVTGPCSAGAIIYNNAPPGNMYPMGTTVVTWTIIDNQGNVHYCYQNVTVTMGYNLSLIGSSVDEKKCVSLKFQLDCPERECRIRYIAFNVKCWKVDPASLWNNYGLPMYITPVEPVTGWYAVVIDGLWDWCDREHPYGPLNFGWTMCPEDDCKPELEWAMIGNPCVEYGTISFPYLKAAFTQAQEPSLSLVPNPTDGQFTLALDLPVEGSVNVRVFDATGRPVMEEMEMLLPAGTSNIPLNSGNEWPSGTYLVALRYNGMLLTRTLVIQQ